VGSACDPTGWSRDDNSSRSRCGGLCGVALGSGGSSRAPKNRSRSRSAGTTSTSHESALRPRRDGVLPDAELGVVHLLVDTNDLTNVFSPITRPRESAVRYSASIGSPSPILPNYRIARSRGQ
jgi:hypothetical protein